MILSRTGSLLLISCCLPLLADCSSSLERPSEAEAGTLSKKPSILLVSIDTARADHLGCYGYSAADTPSLDRLAEEGVLFENMATPAPITLPAHASLLTGLFPNRHGVRDNGVYLLPQDVTTLAEILSTSHYDSAAVVGSAVLDREYGLDQGFRLYDDRVSEHGMLAIPERTASEVTDAALRTAAGLNKPFFLFVHYFDPHAAYRPPSPFRERFSHNPYDGEIAFVDQEIGRLRAGLQAAGAPADTIIAIAADHGEGLGEHGEATHGVFLYQSTIHVPLILVAPGRLPAALRYGGFARLTDVMPTLLDLAGEPVPPELDGRSLLGMLTSGNPVEDAESWLLLESEFGFNSYGWAPLEGITNGKLKWIGAPEPELYDLGSDPTESRNIISALPDEAARLETLWKERFGFDRRSEVWTDQPDAQLAKRLEQLESLGYISVARKRRESGDRLPDPKDVIGTLDQINEARRLIASGSIPAAERILASILSSSPGNLSALILLGSCRIEGGRPAEALEPLRRAAALAPNKADIHFNIGLALLGSGDEAAAIDAWRKTLDISPRYEIAAINLIDLLMQAGRWDDAEALLQRSRDHGLAGPIFDYLEGKMALQRGDAVAARMALRRALEGPLPPQIAGDARRLLQSAGRR